MNRWIGKVAVVTGASAGIGASIVEKLIQKGVIVAGFARRKERIEELAKKLQGHKGKLYAVKVDVSKENEVTEGFNFVQKNLGPVHILVNNAGIFRNNSLIDGNSQKWKEILEMNVFGLCVATREAIKMMIDNNIDGHIIHINSRLGHRVSNFPNTNVYPASKFAVTALAETLRHEINRNKLKIKITSISPGYTETEIVEAAGLSKDNIVTPPALDPEDVAEGVLYALGTPPHVQVAEVTLFAVGDPY